jgi:hypothetical protein
MTQSRNVALLAAWQIELASLVEALGRELTADEAQDQINRINAKLDPEAGIVSGDGCYYPRLNPDGSDPFNL